MNPERLLELYDRVADAPGAVERLRKFVLDLAVRGKLVEQDEGDEPHPALLELIPQDETETPDLPHANWRHAKIGDVLNFQYGKGLKKSERLENGPVPVFGSNGIVGFTTEPLADAPTVIVGRKGSAGALNICNGPSWTTDVAYFVESPPFLELRYLFLSLQSLDLEELAKGVKPGLSRADAYELRLPIPPRPEQIRIVQRVDELMALLDRLEAARTQRKTARDRLTTASLTRLTAPETTAEDFPTRARFSLDNLAQLTTRPDQIKILRQTILNLAVRGKLVGQNPSDEPTSALVERLRQAKERLFKKEGLRKRKSVNRFGRNQLHFDFPETWALPCFDDLFVIVSGVTKGGKVSAEMAVELPYLRVANVQRGYLDLSVIKKIVVKSKDKERYHLRSGDILMTEGGDWDKLGRAAIWENELADCIHQNHIFRVRPPSQEILPDWVIVYVNSELGRSFFEDASKQTTNLASINMTQLRSCPLPLPSLAEQHRIVAKVDTLMSLCDRLEGVLATADTTRVQLIETLLHESLALTSEYKLVATG